MAKHQHLTLIDRRRIAAMLKAEESFCSIAQALGKSVSCISNEVKNRRVARESGYWGHRFNNCMHRRNCPEYGLCDQKRCSKHNCANCQHGCDATCPSFEEEICALLEKPPYVCNGKKCRNRCSLRKMHYNAALAQKHYEMKLSEARQGCTLTPKQLREVDELITPLIRKGLSPYSIYAEYKDVLPFSERSFYRLLWKHYFSCTYMDLPFAVGYKQRQKTVQHKVDRTCRKNRSYKDYQSFCAEHAECNCVQMDTVEGEKGGKCLLTFYFTNCDLALFRLRQRNTARSVKEIFDDLERTLGLETFRRLFPVILTDNGSEFTDPEALETALNGERRTWIFYCDPGVPNQKAGVEGCHKHLRRIIPKGASMENLEPGDGAKVTSHMNAFKRRKLNNKSARDVFSFLYGEDVAQLLQIEDLSIDQIILKPSLLK